MFYGWYVVGCAFLVALWGWGLGFYGPSIYLVALQQAHAWSTATVSMAITAYYLMGALVIVFVGDALRRVGAPRTISGGVVAMAAGVAALTWVDRPWQLYPAFALMAVGWAGMSVAAINIIVAPWFERRRGAAVSLALTGASCGGVFVAPALLGFIERVGFEEAVRGAVLVMGATVLPVVGVVLRRSPSERGLLPDGDPARSPSSPARAEPSRPAAPRRSGALRTGRYWTITIAFSLGLAGQVGILMHLVAYVSPLLGVGAAGAALSLTTLAAVVGRFPVGALADRMDRRIVACLNFLFEVAGLSLLLIATSAPLVYAGCVLFGLGVGNMISLPALLVQREFPPEQFAGLVSLIMATGQFTLALAPGVIGVLRDVTGGYEAALAMCVALELAGALVIVLGRASARDRLEALPNPVGGGEMST